MPKECYTPRVGIVIAMLEKHDLTRKCIDSIFADAGIECDIVVIDDGSKIPYKDSRVHVVRLDKPHGNTYSINSGISFFNNKYEYIVNLDNDIVLKKDAIKYLVEVMDKNPLLALTSSVRYQNTKSGIHLLSQGIDLEGRAVPIEEDTNGVYLCHWICGCAIMLRTKVIREIGMFDKRFDNYCQDAEWCLRARINDYRVAMVCNSRVEHLGSGTIKSDDKTLFEDREILLRIISCHGMQEILKELPIDYANNQYGNLTFKVEKRDVSKHS